ncbi:MAG: histidine phosphatase family protein [Candidatus Micrarchaeota archaeon]|nr:histidine phosphatase family protein [Candidatus Micrarchaeota archaeon]
MAEVIFLVRHGEAESNLKKYFGGWLNDPLTSLGKRQALALRKRLAKENIQRAFCSDLLRARQTIQALRLSCPVEFSAALREKSYGKLEGVCWGEDEEKYQKYHTDAYARAPGGENSVEVQRRVMHFFNSKVFTAHEEKILVVSHHGPLVLLACKLLGMPIKNWRRLRLGNCGLSILTKEGNTWRLKLWNSLSHFGLRSFSPLLSKEGNRQAKSAPPSLHPAAPRKRF